MRKIVLVALLAALLVSCKQPEGYSTQPVTTVSNNESAVGLLFINDRVKVTRIASFRDDRAYDGYRGLYVVVDLKTGKEYIGLSGVGISELGSHQAGKTTKEDER